jgi:hypothetical protein
MVRAGIRRGKIRAAFFWAIILLVQVTVLVTGIGYMSYWTIPPFRVHVEGDSFFSYDSEVGYVARPNSSAKWTVFDADGKISLQFQVHTDGRGARVANRGEQNPKPVDIVFVGDSFTWGYGVEGHETFALKAITALGGTGANLAVAGYGTTHALQLLRRNRDLAPKLVIYPLLRVHLSRNVSSCATSAYPFCLDDAYVAWNEEGRPYIALPRSDGVARVHHQMRAEQGGLDPVTWIVHGLDVIVARLRSRVAHTTASDREKQDAALEFLIREMASTASEMNAALLIVYLPDDSMSPSPEMLSRSTQKLGYRFLDLSEAFANLGAALPTLYLPHDGHPSASGHALIAQELIAYIRRKHLLPQ